MNILIATLNPDKFRIIEGLLLGSGLAGGVFFSLADVNIFSQSEEYGDSINKALLKAQHAFRSVDPNAGIDVFVGADDRMEYAHSADDESSQEVAEKILCHNLLSPGETLTIVRAFALLDRSGRILDKFETAIPYRFLGNPDHLPFLENKYPLNHVLSPLEGGKPLVEMSADEVMDYYLRFSRPRIREAVDKIPNPLRQS